MSDLPDTWTTKSIEALPQRARQGDPTPGFVLIYSKLHRQLPPAIPFAGEKTAIGREADNLLCIPENAVSRYHAVAERCADGFWLQDLGSTNGTLVNGRRIARKRLQNHDVVRVGDTLLRFADREIYHYSPYRIDGSVMESARQIRHHVANCPLIGGYQIDALVSAVEKVARTQLSVIVTGESGTGKELLAKTVHTASLRPGPFQAVNCAALPANLIESELFGYRKGAFTGANQDKTGLIKSAHQGTLFLDEIGDMPLEAQAKLLRVLQERKVLPIGATTPEAVDVRVVCATHRNLDSKVARGEFRGDLFARLREFMTVLPPLRHRREDLYTLIRHFLEKEGRDAMSVSLPYMVGLAHYHWPYNVRELESAIKLSIALSEGNAVLDLHHLPETVQRALVNHGDAEPTQEIQHPIRPTEPSAASKVEQRRPDKAELVSLMTHHKGNIAAVGRALGKERMQIHRWLKKHKIDPNDFR